MDKELLQKKKQVLISLKNESEKNKKSIINFEKENEQLTEEYTNITEQLDNLDKIVFKYETLQASKKFAKVCLVLAILGGIVIGCVDYFGSTLNIIKSIIVSIIGTIGVSSFGFMPYLFTKQGIRNHTNLTLEEVLKQVDDLKNNKKINREKYKNNTKQIEKFKLKNSLLDSNLDALMQSLLKDKEARDEIMDQIMENEPSKELIEIVADNISEISKNKQKTLKK